MPDTFQLEIVTPSRLLVKEPAEEAQIPGVSGYLGILPGHAPLISELGVGEITYKASGASHTLSVAWGFVEVLPDKVLVYLWPRAGGLSLHFRITLRYRIDALTAPSSVYDYYNPDARADVAPVRFHAQ